MATTVDAEQIPPSAPSTPGLLDRQRTIAPRGFNRWLVPPAALAIHLSIGMAYGFSVFWLPLGRAIGIQQPVTCSDAGFLTRDEALRSPPIALYPWDGVRDVRPYSGPEAPAARGVS